MIKRSEHFPLNDHFINSHILPSIQFISIKKKGIRILMTTVLTIKILFTINSLKKVEEKKQPIHSKHY